MFKGIGRRRVVIAGAGLTIVSALAVGILAGVSAQASSDSSLPAILNTPGEVIPAAVQDALTRQPSGVDLTRMHFAGQAGNAQIWIASGTKTSDVCVVAHFTSGTEWIDGSTCYPAVRINEKGASPDWETLYGDARLALVPDGFASDTAASLGGTVVSANLVSLAPAAETKGIVVRSTAGGTMTLG